MDQDAVCDAGDSTPYPTTPGHVDPTPRTIDYTPAVTHVPQSSYNNRPTPSASTPGTNSNSDQV